MSVDICKCHSHAQSHEATHFMVLCRHAHASMQEVQCMLQLSIMHLCSGAGTLLQAWEKCNTKRDKRDIVQRIADNLRSISRPEAEGLPDKDPEHI